MTDACTPQAGIKELISTLHKNSIDVFLVSGGFRVMIEPVAELVDIPLTNIYANTIFFDAAGDYSGFDDTELTSRDGGKAHAINVCVCSRHLSLVEFCVRHLRSDWTPCLLC